MPKTSTKRNAGQFRKGHDPRRKVFSSAEQSENGRRGFWAALEAVTLRYDDDRAKTFGKFLRREGRFTR
jgi:hypothetical protein